MKFRTHQLKFLTQPLRSTNELDGFTQIQFEFHQKVSTTMDDFKGSHCTLSKKLVFASNFRQNILKSKSHILIEYVKIWFRFIHLKLELKILKLKQFS